MALNNHLIVSKVDVVVKTKVKLKCRLIVTAKSQKLKFHGNHLTWFYFLFIRTTRDTYQSDQATMVHVDVVHHATAIVLQSVHCQSF